MKRPLMCTIAILLTCGMLLTDARAQMFNALLPSTANDDAPYGGYYVSAWFSEEGRGQEVCPMGYALKGIQCSGQFCDNKRLWCWPVRSFSGGGDFKNFFSEEQYSNYNTVWDNYHFDLGLVTGMRCSGRYCDNISLRKSSTSRILKTSSCQQSPFFSDEWEAGRNVGNIYVCPGERVVGGVTCQGSFCDNISLYCCDVQ